MDLGFKNAFAGVLVPLCFFFVGYATAAENQFRHVDGAKDLVKVKRAAFSETYINPDVDFSFYNKIYVSEAEFDYREVKPPKTGNGTHVSASPTREYPMSKDDRKRFEETVRTAFRTEVSKGKYFEIVDVMGVDEHTMILRAVVADIYSKVPPESPERSRLYLSSVGGATLGLEFRDRTTSEVLARVAEHGLIGDTTVQGNDGSRPVNPETVNADVDRWASSAARKLRQALDSALKD